RELTVCRDRLLDLAELVPVSAENQRRHGDVRKVCVGVSGRGRAALPAKANVGAPVPVALSRVLILLHELEDRAHLLGRLELARPEVRVGLGRVWAAAEYLAHDGHRWRLRVEQVEARVVDDGAHCSWMTKAQYGGGEPAVAEPRDRGAFDPEFADQCRDVVC